MKRCSACKEEKDFSQFHKHPQTSSGLGSQCKACDAAGRRAKARQKKEKLVQAMGGCCQKCGYDKCLQAFDFHHTSDYKEIEVSQLMKRSFKVAMQEAEKCILLCANCHRELHAEEHGTPEYGAKVKKL